MTLNRKKPLEVEAMQLLDDLNQVHVVARWIELGGGQASEPFLPDEHHVLNVLTLEGEMKAGIGWWVIRGVKGEFYLCAPDIFEATYEPVTEQARDTLLDIDEPADAALAHVNGAVTILDNLPARPFGRHRGEGRAKRWRR